MYSPVFPVSDSVGYEHYGTYQYGRGLSIESGGNYERLMSVDPFEYVDPALALRFADAIQREGVREGSFGPATRAALATTSGSPSIRIPCRIHGPACTG